MDLSDLPQAAKGPIFLPKNHKFLELVSLVSRERVHHCRERAMLAELRARFWISKGRQYMKSVIKSSCFICRKLEGKPFHSPPVAPLPDFRVTEAPSFNRIGVDLQALCFAKNPRAKLQKCAQCHTHVVLLVPFIWI